LRSKKFQPVAKPAGVEGESCDDSVMTSISKQSDDEEDKEDSGNEEDNYNEAETVSLHKGYFLVVVKKFPVKQ